MFWQSSQEVEEIQQHADARPLKKRPRQAPREFRRIRIDTFTGMAVSNIVAIAIMMSTAATLHAQGKTDITTAADAAEALRPIAGDLAFALFSLGIIGTGLLSLPYWQVQQHMRLANHRAGNADSKTSRGRRSAFTA